MNALVDGADLLRLTPVTLDGVPDPDDPDLPRRVRAQALHILATATVPGPEVAWAAGAVHADHATTFAYPVAVHTLAVDLSGHSLDGNRRWRTSRHGLAVTIVGPAGEAPVLFVPWGDVVASVAPHAAALKRDVDRLLEERDDLAARMRHLCRVCERQVDVEYHAEDCDFADDDDDPDDQFDDDDEVLAGRWADVEWRCRHLAARIWDRARPDVVDDVDVFDLDGWSERVLAALVPQPDDNFDLDAWADLVLA